MSTVTTASISDKFAKDLSKFFIWAKENDYVVKRGDTIIEWSQDMLPEFTEPSRNKIDAYVKEIFQLYKLYDKTNIQVEETYIKIITKEFKDNKPLLKKSKKSDVNEIADEIQNANREPKEIVKRKYTKRSVKNTEENVEEKVGKKTTILKLQTDSGMSCSESESEQLEEQFMIKMKESEIKLVHKKWNLSIDDDVNIISVIEYIGNHKDKIIADLKKQQAKKSKKQNDNESEKPKQKKEKIIKKQIVDKVEEVKVLKQKKEKITKKQIDDKVQDIKVQEQNEPRIANWADSVVEPGSPDLADDFGKVTLDDIEF